MKKKIIIVGATSGIGRAMTEIYVAQGHTVGITGRRMELLKEIQQQWPVQIHISCFDVTGTENVKHLEQLVQQMGGLDILVISAGNGEPSDELDWSIEKQTAGTNVSGFLEITCYAFNFFVKQGYGQLATISSLAAIRGGSYAPAYNASKAFQSNYFEGLSIKAKRLKKEISVTCIEPGFVDTKMAKSDKLFWVVPVEKAARQIIRAIEKRRRKIYISRRWWLIAKALRLTPYWLYKRIG